MKVFDPNMNYRVSVLDYGSEVEVRFYPVGVVAPGYGYPTDRRPKYQFDDWMESFEKNVYGEYPDIRVHDLDELEARAERARQSSLSRTVNKVYGIARGYAWEWFCTFTFSPESCDRYDYDDVSRRFKSWLDTSRRSAPDLMYVVVPELHKDGAYHYHGLFSRADEALCPVLWKDNIYNVTSYHYGYSTATPVSRPDAASRYISKYITKDLCAVTKNRRRYWASRNVSSPEPMRCRVTNADRDELASVLRLYAKYTSAAMSPDGEIQYMHFNKDDIPDDVMSFLKLHAIG